MFRTIQSRMLAIFIGFLVLLATTVIISRIVLTIQANDSLIINLAGRQRMLTQKMTKESLQLANAATLQESGAVATAKDELSQTMRVFEATLLALKNGGSAPINLEMTRMRETPAAGDQDLQRQLAKVASLWEPFKAHLQTIIQSGGADRDATTAVGRANLELLYETNAAVTLMQLSSERRVDLLFLVQTLALLLGVALVGVGAWLARASIATPISELAEAARKMSTGDLSVEFSLAGTDEVRTLSASFDRMRASLLATVGAGGSDDDL